VSTDKPVAALKSALREKEAELQEAEDDYQRLCDSFTAAGDRADKAEAELATAKQEREAIMKSLGIILDPDLDAEGSGYEVPAEPEPDYFETLLEAVQFWAKLFEGEINKQSRELERLRGALELAAEESWQVKQGLMEMRESTELAPLHATWIEMKVEDWIRRAALTPDSTPPQKEK
jgi:hypothetical protein